VVFTGLRSVTAFAACQIHKVDLAGDPVLMLFSFYKLGLGLTECDLELLSFIPLMETANIIVESWHAIFKALIQNSNLV
jgi:hypothetical protein